jgi:hypothetical protein
MPQRRQPGKKSNCFKNYLADLQLFSYRVMAKNLNDHQFVFDRFPCKTSYI